MRNCDRTRGVKAVCFFSIFMLIFFILVFSLKTAAGEEDARLSEGYPRLTVKLNDPQETGAARTIEWEIQFNLGPRPEQWDRVVVGEILSETARLEPICWAFTEEPGAADSFCSVFDMRWLARDTMGWVAGGGSAFETLKDKDLVLKLRTRLQPGSGANDLLNGTFINCYVKYALTHYNRRYTGVSAAQASTHFDRLELFAPKVLIGEAS
ncbi:MAG: hypothetical protein LBT44_05980 [Clostridiales bacterium]|jgi:hypothetical protein|nr:hypothetical protein [Clostridiales bacterium]